MIPYLFHEIIYQIILHLVEPDQETGEYTAYGLNNLYPCLFVNHEWHAISVKILWQQPFHFNYMIGAKALETYLKCLSSQDKENIFEKSSMKIDLLHENGLKMYEDEYSYEDYYEENDEGGEYYNVVHTNRSSVMSLDFITNSNSPPNSPPNSSPNSPSNSSSQYLNPVLNYPGFLKRLLYENLYRSSEVMCKHLIEISGGESYDIREDSEDEDEESKKAKKAFKNKVEIIVNSVLKLLSDNGAKIQGLWFIPDSPENDTDKYLILKDHKDLFKDVRFLDICCLFRKNTLFSILGNICDQVNYLHIHTFWTRHHDEEHVDEVGEVVKSLIKSQKSLVSFRLTSCKAYTRIFFPLFSHHQSTLRHVKFDQVDFQGCENWLSISHCSNLKTLEIIQCTNVQPEMIMPLYNHRFGKDFEPRYIKINNSCKELEDWVKRVNGHRHDVKPPSNIEKLENENNGNNNRIRNKRQ